MKVLFIGKMFPRIGNDTFGSYVYEQINELAKLEVEILVVSPHMYIPKWMSIFGGNFKKYAEADENYIYRGIKVYSPPCCWAKEFLNGHIELKYKLFKRSLKKKILKICNVFQPDVIYGIDPLMDGRLCVDIGDEKNIPVVLIEHSVPSNYRNFVESKKAKSIYLNTYFHSSEFIFVSKKQKELFETLLGRNITSKIIYNGFKNENEEDFLPNFDIQTNPIKLISVGFLEDRKGYKVVFEALKILLNSDYDNFELAIIGDGYDKKIYKDIVYKYGLCDKVKFCGIQSHKNVFKYMKQSDIFVLPSYEEAFGIVYLEAMSCGLPIIGTKDEGINDLVINGTNGYLIERENAVELAAVLKKVIDNPHEICGVAKQGYNTSKRFSWKQNAFELKHVFEKVVKDE